MFSAYLRARLLQHMRALCYSPLFFAMLKYAMPMIIIASGLLMRVPTLKPARYDKRRSAARSASWQRGYVC